MRNSARMPTVTTVAILPANAPMASPTHACTEFTASSKLCAAADEPWKSSRLDATCAAPDRIADVRSATAGMKASRATMKIASATATAVTVTVAAAFVVDHPRASRRRWSGRKVAATMTDRRIAAVTVPRMAASHSRSAPKTTITRMRQAKAAARLNHVGTIAGRCGKPEAGPSTPAVT